MKKVYVVSKTHLDLGFTDYAENIRQKYMVKLILYYANTDLAMRLIVNMNMREDKYILVCVVLYSTMFMTLKMPR